MSTASAREIGAARRRVEDPRLIQGQGCYVDDLRLPGTLEVFFVRSQYAHANITALDLAAAREASGVVAVWSGDDVHHQRMPTRAVLPEMKNTPMPALAHGKVNCVGYPIVAVAAESRYAARDAADLVAVGYDPLPAVTTVEEAAAPDAPLLWPELGTNVSYRLVREGGDVDGAFSRADHTLSLHLRHSRVAQIPMEPRGTLASYDREQDVLTVYKSGQSPFGARAQLAVALQWPEEKIHVVMPDVGGAFGSKTPVYPEELLVVLMAVQLGRPVRWASTRMEDLLFTMQGRDHQDFVEAAFTRDGLITGLKVRSLTNFGAFTLPATGATPIRLPDYATGAYRIRNFRSELITAYTNTMSTGPYRGAGRPEAAFVAERTVEEVARTLGMDPAEVRRKNFIQPDEFPYRTPNGALYDSGNYEAAMDKALEVVGYPAFRERQRRERTELGAKTPLRGIGLATTIEVSSEGWEAASVEVQADGTVVARTGSFSHGQGHHTSFAQIVADRLDVPFEQVRIVQGDTEKTPVGIGTFGSRSLSLGGSAVANASEAVKEKALKVASALLETAPEDLVYSRGSVQVAGAPDRSLTLARIAEAAERGVGLPEGERGLRHGNKFDPGKGAVPFGTTIAVVEIDRETGRVRLERMVAVDDCGTIVNPLLVEGQIHGSLTQGIAEALYERIVYDEQGQLQTSTLLDYAVPTARMVPEYETGFTVTPSPFNPIGSKGVGESGCVGAPPAVVNAVLDALSTLGITNLDMPVTAARVWEAVQQPGERRQTG
ncbi:MAG: xanthine dehydrogenase family protein molybdopterin-binding subunit [Chloroflexi bacterium]|nr:xanthine dehydrogenase family protein molybdopterin-binding subunit [Chloroflexota bacterium]